MIKKEDLAELIVSELKKIYPETDIQILEVKKVNQSLLGICIRQPGSSIAPTVYVETYYKGYVNNMYSLADITENIQDVLRQSRETDIKSMTDALEDLKSCVNFIMPKLVNKALSKKLLQEVPHKDIGKDFSLIYCVLLQTDAKEGTEASCTITNNILNAWNVNEEWIYEQAMINLERRDIITMPASKMVHSINECQYPDERCSIDEMCEVDMYLTSFDNFCNGAVIAMNKTFMNKVAKQLNGDFYIIPSSINEIIILPRFFFETIGGKEVVTEILHSENQGMIHMQNLSEAKKPEVLSDYLWKYNAAMEKLEILE
mgnify:CR=1 FL=1